MKRVLFSVSLALVVVVVVQSCGYDSSLREYLDRHFWLPFSKSRVPLERTNVRRISEPFAGMQPTDSGSSKLASVRAAYQQIAGLDFAPQSFQRPSEREAVRVLIAAARSAANQAESDNTLTAAEREELTLIRAKIAMREGASNNDPALLGSARQNLQSFLRSTRDRAFASEARGWIAHIDWLRGDKTAAGKAYLDELNRDGSNLSRETLLNSLHLVYGYDGGTELRSHMAEYFDTPEHAAFAIELVTNPRTRRTEEETQADAATYKAIFQLAEQHRKLFDSPSTSEVLTLLLMRTGLRMGDAAQVLRIVELVPKNSSLLENADLNWMKASAHFVLRDYKSAEQPLLTVFQSNRSTREDKAAAAYGLVGVYQKINNPLEQLRYALWLRAQLPEPTSPWEWPSGSSVEARTVYLAPSGWDLGTLLEYQLSDETLSEFINRYPDAPRLRLVRYALAVRMAREDRYLDAAKMYASIGASSRATRMRQAADLFGRANDPALTETERLEAQYRFAEFLSNNSERIYFNDTLWDHFQDQALTADSDSRLTREERDRFVSGERNLRDTQEERWRAYLTLNKIVAQTGKTTLGRKAAQLALRNLRGIAIRRFGREQAIQEADVRLSSWLQTFSDIRR